MAAAKLRANQKRPGAAIAKQSDGAIILLNVGELSFTAKFPAAL